MKKIIAALTVAFASAASVAQAAIITGNSGPGGFVLANGASPLVAWFKADEITGVGDNTTFGTWVESSNTAGVTATTGGNNPLYHANQPGLNPTTGYTAAVEFQGGRLLNLSGVTSLSVGSVFGVAAPAGDRYLLQHSSNRQLRLRQGGGSNISAYNGGSNPVSAATTTLAGQYLIAEWVATASSVSFFESGAARGTGTLTGGPGGLSDIGYNRIGLDAAGGSQMFVSEFAIFNTTLNSAERQVVENALSAKWNLPLLANNRYTGDDFANGDNDRDVIGVGRVDQFNQVTSAGAAGFGIEVTGGLDDNEWVFAGHRTLVNGLTSDGVMAGTERWLRSWYVEPTGSVDVRLTFDWSDAGLGPETQSFTRLLFSSNGINFTPYSAPFVLDGDRISFLLSGNQLQTGYYTIGSFVPEPSSLWLLTSALLGTSLRRRRRA